MSPERTTKATAGDAEGPVAEPLGVGVDTVELQETAVLGVKEAVPVPEGVGLPVEVGVTELVPVLLAEAPEVREPV